VEPSTNNKTKRIILETLAVLLFLLIAPFISTPRLVYTSPMTVRVDEIFYVKNSGPQLMRYYYLDIKTANEPTNQGPPKPKIVAYLRARLIEPPVEGTGGTSPHYVYCRVYFEITKGQFRIFNRVFTIENHDPLTKELTISWEEDKMVEGR
jgi:hypothetical protein